MPRNCLLMVLLPVVLSLSCTPSDRVQEEHGKKIDGDLAHVKLNSPTNEEMCDLLSTAAADPNDPQAVRNTEAFFSHSELSVATQIASEFCERYPGTRVALASHLFIVRNGFDGQSPKAYEKVFIPLVTKYAPEFLVEPQVYQTLILALDASGFPGLAEGLSAVEGEERIRSARRLQEHFRNPPRTSSLVMAPRTLFAADFLGLTDTAKTEATNLLQVLANASPQDEKIPEMAHNLVQGICRRSHNLNSVFSQRRLEAVNVTNDLVRAAVALLITCRPQDWQAEVLGLADCLRKNELFLAASHCYKAVLQDPTESPARVTAAAHLSDVYLDAWQASEMASSVLESAIKDTPARPLLSRLAQIRYKRGDFEGARDLLLSLLKEEQDATEKQYLEFFLGLTYKKLGDEERSVTIWQDLLPIVTDEALSQALEVALNG